MHTVKSSPAVSSVSVLHPRVRFWAAFAAWAAAALVAASAGIISPDRPWLIPLVLLSTTSALVISFRRSVAFRQFCHRIDTRWLLAYHGIRAPIGAWFLFLMVQGRLGPDFALPAGWGDIAAGILALGSIPLANNPRRRARLWLKLWNAFALMDILFVIASAQRVLVFGDDLTPLAGLLAFPGPLLPLFIVPLVIGTHLLLVLRLRSQVQAQV